MFKSYNIIKISKSEPYSFKEQYLCILGFDDSKTMNERIICLLTVSSMQISTRQKKEWCQSFDLNSTVESLDKKDI